MTIRNPYNLKRTAIDKETILDVKAVDESAYRGGEVKIALEELEYIQRLFIIEKQLRQYNKL